MQPDTFGANELQTDAIAVNNFHCHARTIATATIAASPQRVPVQHTTNLDEVPAAERSLNKDSLHASCHITRLADAMQQIA